MPDLYTDDTRDTYDDGSNQDNGFNAVEHYYFYLGKDAQQYGAEAEYLNQFYGFVKELHDKVASAVATGNGTISRGDWQPYPSQGHAQVVNDFFDNIFQGQDTVSVEAVLQNPNFETATNVYNQLDSAYDFATGWSDLGSVESLNQSFVEANTASQGDAITSGQQTVDIDTDDAQLGTYVDVINDNLDIPAEFDAEFNAWLSGQLLGENTQMSPELVSNNYIMGQIQSNLFNEIDELGDWQEFDITSLPADSTETNGVAEVLETGTDSAAAQNAIAQTIADSILSGDIYSPIYRPQDTGDPVVDDFIQQIFGNHSITSGAGILDRNDVFSDWLQTNNPEDYQTISDINDDRAIGSNEDVFDVAATEVAIDQPTIDSDSSGVPVTVGGGSDIDLTIMHDLPQNPTEGQTHVADGINWIYTNGNWQVATTSETTDVDVTNLPTEENEDVVVTTTNTDTTNTDTTNLPAGGTETNGDTVMWPANPTEGQTHTAHGANWVYTNGGWHVDVRDNPTNNTIVEGEHEMGNGWENIIYSVLSWLSGGGGSMSQDQANVLQNVLKDLVDVTITQGPTTSTSDVDIGPTTTTSTSDVDIGPTTSTSDVDIGPTTLTTGPSTADVDIGSTTLTTGPSTADATIEEGAVTNVISDLITAPIFAEGAFDINDLISEGAVTSTGGAGGTGGTSTIEAGAISNAPVFTDAVNLEDMFQEGAITGGAGGTSTIEAGAISNAPVFTDAVNLEDMFQEGAITGGAGGTSTIEEGAVTSTGGAGGAGGTGGTGGSIEAGAISNAPVFTDAVDLSDMISAPLIGEGAINIDTAGLGTAVDSFGNVIGGFGENLMDFLGTFVGGQNQQSENSLAGILAEAAARKYAAEAFEDASANELAFQKGIYEAGIEYQEPFYDLGVTAAKEVMPDYVEASKADVTYDDFDPFDAEDPALRFLQDEQRRALESSSAARGRLNSGGTLTDLQDRAANIALTRAGEVGNIRQQMNEEARLRDAYDLDKLDALISRSQRSADVMSGQGAGYATEGGRILENLGGFQADNSADQSEYYRNILRDLFGI